MKVKQQNKFCGLITYLVPEVGDVNAEREIFSFFGVAYIQRFGGAIILQRRSVRKPKDAIAATLPFEKSKCCGSNSEPRMPI